MTKQSKPQKLSERNKETMITNMLADFLTDDSVDELFSYLEHIKLDVCELPKGADGRLLMEHCFAHYRQDGVINIDKACQDLAEYPPIAARIAELEAAKQAEQANHPA